jgi:hypothetical protein
MMPFEIAVQSLVFSIAQEDVRKTSRNLVADIERFLAQILSHAPLLHC